MLRLRGSSSGGTGQEQTREDGEAIPKQWDDCQLPCGWVCHCGGIGTPVGGRWAGVGNINDWAHI